MNDHFEVRGTQAFRDLGTAFKRAGDGQIKKDLLREIRSTAKPITVDVKASLAAGLPQRGGLAQRLSKGAKVRVRNRLSGDTAGVQLQVVVKGHDMKQVEAGQLRHPVYGRAPWVTQRVKPGLVAAAVERNKALVRDAVVDAVEAAVTRIEVALR